MGWIQLSSLVRSKRHGTACAIGPKGEARTFEPHGHRVLILPLVMVTLSFLTIPWLGPKDTEPPYKYFRSFGT